MSERASGGGCLTELLAGWVIVWIAFHITPILDFLDAWLTVRP